VKGGREGGERGAGNEEVEKKVENEERGTLT